jgi:membrane-associated HD superfamily phosphohydrolase
MSNENSANAVINKESIADTGSNGGSKIEAPSRELGGTVQVPPKYYTTKAETPEEIEFFDKHVKDGLLDAIGASNSLTFRYLRLRNTTLELREPEANSEDLAGQVAESEMRSSTADNKRKQDETSFEDEIGTLEGDIASMVKRQKKSDEATEKISHIIGTMTQLYADSKDKSKVQVERDLALSLLGEELKNAREILDDIVDPTEQASGSELDVDFASED